MATVLVTGANRGIGLEFVRQLLARGEQVIAACRDPDTAEALRGLKSDRSNLTLLKLDVSSEESMKAFPGLLNGQVIDILINNAGIYGPRNAQFGEVEQDIWSSVFQVNTIAPLLLTQILHDNLNQGLAKKLVYLTSKMGSIDDNKGGGSYIYRSSKSALNSVVKSLAVDLKAEGFAVAVLHPGWVRTDMGGPNGLIDTQTSVSGMLEVIDGLSQDNTGSFFNYDGSVIPW